MSNAGERWDQAYLEPGSAPWDIGRPQSAIVGLADGGEIRSPVLDSGCGTGEQFDVARDFPLRPHAWLARIRKVRGEDSRQEIST
jgi:hypothetical protein